MRGNYRASHVLVDLGWVDLDLGSSPGWWAATVATFCPSRVVEHPKSKSTKPSLRGHGTPCTHLFISSFILISILHYCTVLIFSFSSRATRPYAGRAMPGTCHTCLWNVPTFFWDLWLRFNDFRERRQIFLRVWDKLCRACKFSLRLFPPFLSFPLCDFRAPLRKEMRPHFTFRRERERFALIKERRSYPSPSSLFLPS